MPRCAACPSYFVSLAFACARSGLLLISLGNAAMMALVFPKRQMAFSYSLQVIPAL